MATDRYLLDVETTTHSEFSVEDDKMLIRTVTNPAMIKALLDQNHQDRLTGQNPNSHGIHAGRIDLVTRKLWKREWETGPKNTIPWGQFLLMKLRSRDNAKLRTTEKRL